MSTDAATTTSTGTSRFTSWDDDPAYGDGAPVPRVAWADVEFSWEGDLVGTSTCRFAFRYDAEGACAILGFEEVTGRLEGGDEGGFALRHEGTFGADGLDLRSSVVEGSGVGALASVAGTGSVTAPAGDQTCRWTLELTGR